MVQRALCLLLATLLALGAPLAAQAQGQGQPGGADRQAAIEKLVADWNDARNRADINALASVFHPEERDTARAFYANQRPATVRVKVLAIQTAHDVELI